MNTENIKNLLNFTSTAIWQAIVLFIAYYFRHEIRLLVERITKLKIGETEAIFQPPSSNPPPPGEEAKSISQAIAPDGFFTTEGLTEIIKSSKLTEADESISHLLLLFKTTKQQTWIISTTKQLFCILDDEETRRLGQLIQWNIPLYEATPITARPFRSSVTVGLVDIGDKRGWFFSKSLFPYPEKLEQELANMITAK